MTSPFPGWTAPSPRTWSAEDLISVPRLRGDMTNLAELMTSGRPMLNIQQVYGQSIPSATATPVGLTTAVLNTWSVTAVTDPVTPQPNYTVPLAGWYLCQGSVGLANEGAATYKYVTGIQAVQNSVTVNSDGAAVPGNGAAAANINGAAAELLQLNPATGDTVAVYAFQNTGISISAGYETFTVEWVALPTQGSSGYSAPFGTVVASPATAASFPSGQGTYITNSGGISAGATSMTVNDATGMIVNGTLGLDYINGQLNANTAEAVTISSVAGTTIGISATSYAHLQNAPVAVPVSYAFLNQQCRDLINFLAYPPLLRMAATTTQSVTSTTFPAGTQIIHLSTASGGIDNFGGVAGSSYTIQVAGCYFVYGQVYLAGSSSLFGCSAGISVNGGTIQWGDLMRVSTSGATSMCPVVRRMLRLNAGDVLTLYGYTSVTMNTVSAGADNSRILAVWRST